MSNIILRRIATTLIFGIAFFIPAVVGAASYALLAGIGNYPHLSKGEQLDGPAHDVAALEKLFVHFWGIENKNIISLVDTQATKQNILDALALLDRKSSPGDFIFVYFSGHGTSQFDPQSRRLGLDPFTGALVPADFRVGTTQQMLNRLIVGNRDLYPLLKRLDKGRTILAVFDACHSGYTVRGLTRSMRSMRVLRHLKSKNLPLPWEDLTGDTPGQYGAYTLKTPEFPYRNITYISASSTREPAFDMSWEAVRAGAQTIDGKPHGVLTNVLLRGLYGAADLDSDKKISVQELYSYSRQKVTRQVHQTPGLLYSKKNRDVIGQAVFNKPIEKTAPEDVQKRGPLRVRCENLPPNLEGRIKEIPGVEVVSEPFDLLVSEDRSAYRLFLSNGTMMASFPKNRPESLLERLSRQVRIKRLAGLTYPSQRYNVFLELTGKDGVLVGGDSVGFNIRPGIDSHLLLINIDPAGSINVIYPMSPREMGKISARAGLSLPDIGEVGPPFGIETIKVFAFRDRPSGFSQLMGTSFSPMDRRFSVLMEIVDRQGTGLAQMTIQLKTAARSDIVRSVRP